MSFTFLGLRSFPARPVQEFAKWMRYSWNYRECVLQSTVLGGLPFLERLVQSLADSLSVRFVLSRRQRKDGKRYFNRRKIFFSVRAVPERWKKKIIRKRFAPFSTGPPSRAGNYNNAKWMRGGEFNLYPRATINHRKLTKIIIIRIQYDFAKWITIVRDFFFFF